MSLPSSPRHRLRPGTLALIALALFLFAGVFGWAFVGGGRARFRQQESTSGAAAPGAAAPATAPTAPAGGAAPAP